MTRKRIDLSVGGTDWQGWYFGPWGRAKDWRLHDPNGTNYIASEIAQIRPMEYNLDYYQVTTKQLEQRVSEIQKPLLDSELEALQIAIALLARLTDGRLIEMATSLGEMVMRRGATGSLLRLKHSNTQHPLVEKLPQDLSPQIPVNVTKRSHR